MVRITFRSGVWKNTEDEILKAAVMKYGLNNWSRCASLLHSKNGKQCKARWYEWLDPSIKKTEWTREEEEKLLHLAKIMPTQWRTIAPMVGRTPAQCLEHYERLLSQASSSASASASVSGADTDNLRKLRPGEVDPTPEARPARPDPVDMDEDEKEMLMEARARLANTQGKKAKRKARERQLNEARRLASLQKIRELRAAGIEPRKRKRKKNMMDLNAEIPFEMQAPKGFFDTAADRQRTRSMRNDPKFIGSKLHELDKKKSQSDVERAEKRAEKRAKLMRKVNLPAYLEKVSRLNDPHRQRIRSSVVLPAPQITDEELEDITKLGQIGSRAAQHAAESGAAATKTLVGTYAPTPLLTSVASAAARTPMVTDNIQQEASRLLQLQSASTPLMMKDGPELDMTSSDFDFSGMTPQRKQIATPNPLAMSAASGSASASASTSGSTSGSTTSAATPMRTPSMGIGGATPLRDTLSINGNVDPNVIAAQQAQRNKRHQSSVRKRLRAGLSSLPAPSNEYQLMMPELPPDTEDDNLQYTTHGGRGRGRGGGDDGDTDDIEEDEELRQARLAELASATKSEKLSKRSQAVKHCLPRPTKTNTSMSVQLHPDLPNSCTPHVQEAHQAVRKEMMRMIRHDQRLYPTNTPQVLDRVPEWEEFTSASLKKAHQLIAGETEAMIALELEAKSMVPSQEVFDVISAAVHKDSYFLPGLGAFGSLSASSKKEQLRALKQEFKLLTDQYAKASRKSKKLENKLNILTGGFQKRSTALSRTIQSTFENAQQASRELECYRMLHETEKHAIPIRQQLLEDEVNAQKKLETQLQRQYEELQTTLQQLMQ
jgi:pre-mRNA-splicing factor CDC5/CEF1